MTEYSRVASGRGTILGTALPPIYLPFRPQRVEWDLIASYSSPSGGANLSGFWDEEMGQGFFFGLAWNGAATALVTNSGSTGGVTTFAAGDMLEYGAKKQVVSSTQGASTSFQVTGHGYAVGDVVVFQGLYQTATTGMIQMATVPLEIITVTDANNFIVGWNSSGSNYTNLSSSPAGATVMKVLYPNLYVPGVNFITAISGSSNGATVVFAQSHYMVVGQQVAFHIPAAWGSVELNESRASPIPSSPNYYYVTSVIDARTVVVSYMGSVTTFNPNQPTASVSGQQFPQGIAVGDVNTGGFPIYANSPLYPPPRYLTLAGSISTINGPAIQGAFVNNTRQGFIIGPSAIVGNVSGSEVVWRAYYDDYRLIT